MEPRIKRRQWYKDWPGEDLNDLALARCGLSARGAFMVLRTFIRLYCESGRLVASGKPVPLADVAFLCHVEAPALEAAVAELVEKNVATRNGEVLELPREVAGWEDYARACRNGYEGAQKRWPGNDRRNPMNKPIDPPIDPPTGSAPDPTQVAIDPPMAFGPDPNSPLIGVAADPNSPLKGGLFHARARASASTSTSTSTSEGGAGEGEESSKVKGQSSSQEIEPQTPTLEEFLAVAAFVNAGIPPDYLEDKWRWFEGNRAWLTARNELKDFRVLVLGWWKVDRAKWRPAADSQSPMANSRAAGVEALEVALKGEKNAEKRAALRRELAALEARKKPAVV